jgi:carbon monoxide dehydrogenase subunit G
MAEFQISESIKIDRPAEMVFQYIIDVTKHAEWRPGLEAIRDYSGAPFAAGTTFSEVSKFMGREMVVDFAVTAIEEGRQADLRMEGGVVSGNMVWAVSPDTDESSTFTLSFDGKVTGWLGRLGTGLIRRQAGKDMTSDLANLKARQESN